MNVKTAIQDYLNVITSNEDGETERIQKLILCLDELAVLSNKVDYTFDERDYPDPPERDYKALRDCIGKLFPSLGFYNSPSDISEEVGKSAIAIGDAIDDMADIAGDLKEVVWRFDNTSENDALFHLQLYFRSHWGMHLRSLQLYLHDYFW